MPSKQAVPGTKRPREGECCTHIDVGGHSVRQLRLLLLKALPGQQVSMAESVWSAAADRLATRRQRQSNTCQSSEFRW